MNSVANETLKKILNILNFNNKLLVLLQTIQLDKIPSNSHFSLFDDYLQGTIAIL